MPETAKQLTDAQHIAERICRILTSEINAPPEFPLGDVPVRVVARVYGKKDDWVKSGIVAGWLPIGRATRGGKLVTDVKQIDSRYGRINYQISPKKLWEDTGYIWKGERE